MRQLIALVFLLTGIVAGCSKKVVPDSNKTAKTAKMSDEGKEKQGDPSQKTEEHVEDPDLEKGKPSSNEPAPVPPTNPQPPPPTNMPKGPEKSSSEDMGKAIYNTKCNKCHGSKNVKNYTFNQWESILKTMVPNAKLSGEEEGYVVAYIRANSR